jgi:hypothetical protein
MRFFEVAAFMNNTTEINSPITLVELISRRSKKSLTFLPNILINNSSFLAIPMLNPTKSGTISSLYLVIIFKANCSQVSDHLSNSGL